MNLVISDFCHFVEGENNLVALYNSLTLGVVIVDKKIASLIQNSNNRIISIDDNWGLLKSDKNVLLDSLISHKIVFPFGERLDLEDYRQLQKGLDCKNLGILYLLMTDACNLRCAYCFVESKMSKDYQFSLMSFDTAKYGIDLFSRFFAQNHGNIDPQIIIYGGEPIMNFAVVQEVLLYIASLRKNGGLPRNAMITINTNGTLVSDAIADALSGIENLNVAISLDGPREINDTCRKFLGGEGTYNDVITAYNRLIERGISTGFSCTINKNNIDNLYDISRWFVDELGVSSIGFNLLIDGQDMEQSRGDFDVYAQNASSQIINCFKFFRERGIYEDRIMRKVNAFVDGYIYYYDCGGCGQQIVLSPDGKIGVCQGYCGTKKYFIEPDDSFNPFTHPIWDEWRHRSPLFMKQCKDCIALSVCGGGCPHSADFRKGSIWELDEGFCVHAKATVEFLIKDLIKKVN